MTAEFRSTSVRVARHGIGESGLSGRSFATMLTGGAVALALVLGAAMPAKADKKDDLAKALVAALIIGAIVHETKDDPKPQPVKQPKVPSVCAISIEGAQRDVTLFPESCLRREGFDYRLPKGCANKASIFGRSDKVYSAECLRDAGFRVSGR